MSCSCWRRNWFAPLRFVRFFKRTAMASSLFSGAVHKSCDEAHLKPSQVGSSCGVRKAPMRRRKIMREYLYATLYSIRIMLLVLSFVLIRVETRRRWKKLFGEYSKRCLGVCDSMSMECSEGGGVRGMVWYWCGRDQGVGNWGEERCARGRWWWVGKK